MLAINNLSVFNNMPITRDSDDIVYEIDNLINNLRECRNSCAEIMSLIGELNEFIQNA